MSAHRPLSRVAVPEHVRVLLREIQRRSGSIRKAVEILQCSIATFEDATAEAAMLRPETLEKLQKKIGEWIEREKFDGSK